MGFTSLFLALLSLSTVQQGTWAAIPIKDAKDNAELPFLRNRYIVEVESISQSGFTSRSVRIIPSFG